MNWNMLYLLTANNMTIGESAGYALRMVVVGLGMVFAVLAILWGVLEILRIVFHEAPKRRREAEIAAHKAEAASAPAAPAPAPVVAPKNDDVLIAVITAAVAAAMAEEGTSPATGFRVVSFRRTGGNHAWNRK